MVKTPLFLYHLTQEELDKMAGTHVDMDKLSRALRKRSIPNKFMDSWRDKSKRYVEFQSTEDEWNSILVSAIKECTVPFFH